MHTYIWRCLGKRREAKLERASSAHDTRREKRRTSRTKGVAALDNTTTGAPQQHNMLVIE